MDAAAPPLPVLTSTTTYTLVLHDPKNDDVVSPGIETNSVQRFPTTAQEKLSFLKAVLGGMHASTNLADTHNIETISHDPTADVVTIELTAKQTLGRKTSGSNLTLAMRDWNATTQEDGEL